MDLRAKEILNFTLLTPNIKSQNIFGDLCSSSTLTSPKKKYICILFCIFF